MSTPELPLIALVGRPNVGKSSLFNTLTKKRQAIVADYSGVTRDRRFGKAYVDEMGGRPVRVVDTGGWMPEAWRKEHKDRELLQNVEKQILKALQESSVIVLVMNVREGVTTLDEEIVGYIRKLNKPFVIVANKADDTTKTYDLSEFYALGAEEVIAFSAEHKHGITDFWQKLLPFFGEYTESPYTPEAERKKAIRVCIVGRPNVGKSTFLNHIVGEERSVASSEAGTTTDTVDVLIERDGQDFLVMDTAGIRRHAKRKDDVEQLAVMYASRNLNESDIAFLVVDAEQGVTAQDSKIAALVEESGCTAILFANKWDLSPREIRNSNDGLEKFYENMKKEVPFLEYAPLLAISAERGKLYGAKEGTDAEGSLEPWNLPTSMDDIWSFAKTLVEARELRIPAEEISELVKGALIVGPNMSNDVGELRQIHQVGNRPPQFLAFVRDANKVPEALRRYLSRVVRGRYGYRGNPIRWTFKHRAGRTLGES